MNRLGHITILVADFDKAHAFYKEKLGFAPETDVNRGSYRWRTLKAKDQADFAIIFSLQLNILKSKQSDASRPAASP